MIIASNRPDKRFISSSRGDERSIANKRPDRRSVARSKLDENIYKELLQMHSTYREHDKIALKYHTFPYTSLGLSI